MYSITPTDYGFHLIFGGIMETSELEQWVRESAEALSGISEPFYVLVDMRSLGPLAPEGKLVMERGQRLYREAGMHRSTVILSNPVTMMQFKRIAHESGIYEYERYIDASTAPNWGPIAMAWLLEGIDPAIKQIAPTSPQI